MNFLKKYKAKHYSNYLIKEIEKYLNDINEYEYYVKLVNLKSTFTPINLNVRFDNKSLMESGFISYYESLYGNTSENFKYYETRSFFKKLADCRKQYKQRPSKKFYKIVCGLMNRYCRSASKSDKEFYNMIDNIIHNCTLKREISPNNVYYLHTIMISKSLKGCKIIIK